MSDEYRLLLEKILEELRAINRELRALRDTVRYGVWKP